MKTEKGKSFRKLIFWIFRIILILIISIVLGISIYSFSAKHISGNQLPMPFGYGLTIVLSGSMEPELAVNDLVIVKEVSPEEIKVGDTIVYENDGELIIHKVVSIDSNSLTTQGIANNVADNPISLSDIKGVMVGKIPALGSVVSALKSPIGIILLIALAVILFEMPYFMKKKSDERDIEKIKEEIKKLKDEKNEDEDKQ